MTDALPLGLPAKRRAQLEWRDDYAMLTQETEDLTLQIEDRNTPDEAHERYEREPIQAYVEG